MCSVHRLTSVLVLCFVALTGSVVFAQGIPLPELVPTPGATFDQAMPQPESVLGVPQGMRHTRPDEIVRYFERVAAASPRVLVREHGRTHEGRPLIHAIVTHPDHHANLESIRERQIAEITSGGRESAKDNPIVVWMGYGVHGNESSAHEASLTLLYFLAAGQGEKVERILRNLVIIIDPSLNPDGHDRFVDWVNGQRGRQATDDAQDREHRAPWPSGRTNHYLFDLNRDWLLAVHPESRARLDLWHAWRPHLHTDFHEMGGERTFFFQPGIPSRTNPRTPGRVTELTGKIAEFHARGLDAVGQPYFTRESFDDYYYGKGSTYPDVQGSVGILFEQGSSRGLRAATTWGPLTYARGIRNQTIVSLTSIEAAVSLQKELRANRQAFIAESKAPLRDGASYWRIPLAGQRTRAQLFAQLCLRHRIEVSLTEDALCIPAAQPQRKLLASLMEPVTTVPDTSFYDVSAWTMPMAYGLDLKQVRGKVPEGAVAIEDMPLDGGAVLAGEGTAGWFLGWSRFYAPRALVALQEAGVITRLVTSPRELRNGHQVAAGDVFLPAQQPELKGAALEELMGALAERDHVVFSPAAAGRSLRGADLGSPGQAPLPSTRLAILCGPGTSAYRTGELWHHLDLHLGLTVSRIDVERLADIDLRDYDVIVAPGGRYDGLGSKPGEALGEWVEAGGTLIAVGTASGWLGRTEISKNRTGGGTINPGGKTFGARRALRAVHLLAGAFLEVRLDMTHPLSYGIGFRVHTFRSGTHEFIEEPSLSGTIVGKYADDPVVSGYASSARRARLVDCASIVVERRRSGRIVHFLDQLAFRGTMLGSSRLLANAIFFRRVL